MVDEITKHGQKIAIQGENSHVVPRGSNTAGDPRFTSIVFVELRAMDTPELALGALDAAIAEAFERRPLHKEDYAAPPRPASHDEPVAAHTSTLAPP